jgi:[acyl-carrier-protein] S-malonyltransferase
MNFAVLCPGQGTQHARMLDAALAHPAARRLVDEAAETLGEDPRKWMAGEADIFANRIAQPLVCLAQLAVWSLMAERVERPIAFAGYSVGELSCYGLAGAFDGPALVRLARDRAALMDEASASEPGGLVAIRGLTRSAIESCRASQRAWIAIANGRDAFVVGGTRSALAIVERCAREKNGQTTPLRVSVASHTPLLEMAVAPFRAVLSATPFRSPASPVVAGIDARLVTTAAGAIDTLSAQLAQTVEWAQCIDTLYERGCRVFLELPPGRALSRMVLELHGDVEVRAVEEFRDLGAVSKWIEGR